MKRIYLITTEISVALSILFAVSCTKQESIPQITLTSSENNVEISDNGQSAYVRFTVEENATIINVVCDWEWRLESATDYWCAVEMTSDNGIRLIASENETGADRSSSITIVSENSVGKATATINIEQSVTESEPLKVTLQNNDTEIILPEEGGSYRVGITSGIPWQAVAGASWMDIEQDSEGFTLTVSENSTIDTLSGVVEVVTGSGGFNERTQIPVTQFSSAGAMILELTVGEESNYAGTLPFDNSGIINCLVDWGDGQLSRVLESWPSHIYNEAGVYNVRIIGKVSSFRGNQEPQFSDPYRKCITAILDWGNIGIESLKRGFYKCVNLKHIAAPDEDSFELLTSVYECFYSNTSIEYLPEGMFANAPVLTDAYSAFTACSGLKAVPDSLFAGCSKNETFFRLFWKCTSLTEIGKGVFDGCTSVEKFGQIFYNTPIKSIPEGLFASCTSATEFANAFNGCTELTEIPADLFSGLSNVTSFNAVFSNCVSLASVPSSLFDDNKAVTNFGNAFMGCTSLQGESPYTVVDGTKYHIYERDSCPEFTAVTTTKGCFKDCTGLDDYSVIESSYPDWL